MSQLSIVAETLQKQKHRIAELKTALHALLLVAASDLVMTENPHPMRASAVANAKAALIDIPEDLPTDKTE